MTIAVGGNVVDQGYVKMRVPATGGSGIFRHFATEGLVRIRIVVFDRVEGTGPDAAPAAFAEILINMRLHAGGCLLV